MTVTRTTPDPDVPPGGGADGHLGVVSWLRSAATSWVTLLLTVPLLLASLYWSWIRLRNYALDLDIYRIGVQVWLAGGDMYGELPPPLHGPVLPFIYPVFAAIAMVPLAVVPYAVAFTTQFVVSVVSLAICIALAIRVAWPAGGWRGGVVLGVPVLAAALLTEPVAQTFAFGQINLVLMLLVLVDCLAPRTLWPRGMLLGLAAAIKLTPAGFVLFLLVRRDWKACAVAVVTGTVATLIGFVVDPASSYRYWFVGGPAAGVSGSTFFSNETVQAVLARQEVPEPWFTVLWLTIVAVLLALAVPVIRRSEPVLALAATAAVVLMATPTAWSHHWVWVVPGLIAIGAHAIRHRSMAWAALGAVIAAIFYIAPFRWMPNVWGVEMRWSLWEQVLGASYVIPSAIALGLGCWYVIRGPGRPGGPQAPAPERLRVGDPR
ncbi:MULTISPECIES: glycosyltransferase family 87 protein [Pseudonocardia]|uniref:Polyprenol-phosphate-mannose-dependent alpha-(1-2)-phosphatidylinositol mannoside mannosyltransferase n=2 Tax=Pseudonocardia TaxID=1847 RepID=A0A1Y2MTD6_PSEAH|nr:MULTISPECIES: glycosyltransferase family 87 protein [Pseudonocardia]OSY38259.1 Polyprenol-phosphate-mannose-dependent alpha-(1-2)-phosphatidylinositol mannoside mannosyltransferase [Pseudonocardia autotrophica]TDN71015.1 alpha-1,2-mannosyltransferase [Pseudonocardia autotrophica]BBG01683.1 membrane protein [Pseudonocardia autotrophica]GEC25428.1 membrane protein [Pseudonocardia saturnea]